MPGLLAPLLDGASIIKAQKDAFASPTAASASQATGPSIHTRRAHFFILLKNYFTMNDKTTNEHNNKTMKNFNNKTTINCNMSKDNSETYYIPIDDFDVDYSVLPISNRQIDATLHESALRRQEEGRVIMLSTPHRAARRAIERSRRAAVLARIRLRLDPNSKSDGKFLPLTPEAFQVHLRLKRAKATLLKHFQLKHKMQRKAAAIKATQDACDLKIQRAKARRRLALVSAAAAAVGRSWVRSLQQQRPVPLPPTCTLILSYEDICAKTTAQLLGMLLELRDSNDHRLYAMVQGELGARSIEGKLKAFDSFLHCQEDKASRAASATAGILLSVEGDPENGYACYPTDAPSEDDEASLADEHIDDLDSWDPPLLPALRKHVGWLPNNTPLQFYEDLRAANEYKTEQARKRSTRMRWIAVASTFAVILVAVAFVFLSSIIHTVNQVSSMPVVKRDLTIVQIRTTTPTNNVSILLVDYSCSSRTTADRYSTMPYASVELLLPRWAYRHPTSMALSTIVSPRAIVVFQQATRIAPPNFAESADDRIFWATSDPNLVDTIPTVKMPTLPSPSIPMRTLSMLSHPSILAEQPTVLLAKNVSMLVVSCPNNSALYRSKPADLLYSSMPYTSVELLLPRWAYRHPASMALSAIISPRAIVVFQQAARIEPNFAKNDEPMNRSVAFDPDIVHTIPTAELSPLLHLPMQTLSILAHPSILAKQPTVLLASSSITMTDSCSSTANGFSSMPYASVEILLPPWAYHHPASLTLSTIVSPRVIAISHHQPTTIALNVSESDRLRRSRSTSSSTLPIVMSQQVLIRFAAVPTISQGALLLPQHQHAAALPPPDPPPGLSRSGRFRGCHCGGALPVAYLLESPLPPPEPPPGALVVAVLGLGVCIVLFDV